MAGWLGMHMESLRLLADGSAAGSVLFRFSLVAALLAALKAFKWNGEEAHVKLLTADSPAVLQLSTWGSGTSSSRCATTTLQTNAGGPARCGVDSQNA